MEIELEKNENLEKFYFDYTNDEKFEVYGFYNHTFINNSKECIIKGYIKEDFEFEEIKDNCICNSNDILVVKFTKQEKYKKIVINLKENNQPYYSPCVKVSKNFQSFIIFPNKSIFQIDKEEQSDIIKLNYVKNQLLSSRVNINENMPMETDYSKNYLKDKIDYSRYSDNYNKLIANQINLQNFEEIILNKYESHPITKHLLTNFKIKYIYNKIFSLLKDNNYDEITYILRQNKITMKLLKTHKLIFLFKIIEYSEKCFLANESNLKIKNSELYGIKRELSNLIKEKMNLINTNEESAILIKFLEYIKIK